MLVPAVIYRRCWNNTDYTHSLWPTPCS